MHLMVSCGRGKVVAVNAATRVSKWIAGRSSNSLPPTPARTKIPRKALITCFCTGSKAPINHHLRPEAFRSANASILPKSQHRIFKVRLSHIWGTFTWTEIQPERDAIEQCISMDHSHYKGYANTPRKINMTIVESLSKRKIMPWTKRTFSFLCDSMVVDRF